MGHMSSALPFIKMHGLGNDFVVVEGPAWSDAILTPEMARKICDRRFGIGADQILWLRKPQDASAATRMEILNADGSTAEMCGNGIRAVALHLAQSDPSRAQGEMKIETAAGMKVVSVDRAEVRVDMGPPRLGAIAGERLEIGGRFVHFNEVSMGNPHAVIFVDDFAAWKTDQWGPWMENHPRFPQRTNVEFVKVIGPNVIEVQVWERGAGETLACGTGACASAVAALALGKVKGLVEVRLPGGKLEISWDGEGRPVFMKGPAVEVYRGQWPLG